MTRSLLFNALIGLSALSCVLLPLRAKSRADQSAQASEAGEGNDVKDKAKSFLATYLKNLKRLETAAALAQWKAANTGSEEDFADAAEASLAVRTFHSDPEVYQRVKELTGQAEELTRTEARTIQLAELAYRSNQLPPDLLQKMVELSTEIERSFGTFRATIDDRQASNNDLLEILAEEDDSARRRMAWEALKQVGGAVAPKLIQLAKLRNQAAHELGFNNYWEMQIVLQEHDPDSLLAVFDELDRLTRDPFAEMKAAMDGELANRFGVKASDVMPWHYDNPFFQAAPPSDEIDLNEFYEKKTGEEIVEISRAFYADIGLPAEAILKRSDLYEREGKDQHAFCTSIDRADDVRVLCNVKPTAEWADTMLHELGHAVYDVHIDRSLPFNLREPAHAFTTEGVAMLFGALAKNPSWMIRYAGADESRVREVQGPILEQRRREQLIFARWTLVMLHFEKAFYQNPEQDLNSLWWDFVERFQQLKRPTGRDLPDWAAKPHFTIAPVYYHNYMLGELFASQLRHKLAELAGHEGPAAELRFEGREDFGEYLKENVFRPGKRQAWARFVRRATGERLTAKYFAGEVQ